MRTRERWKMLGRRFGSLMRRDQANFAVRNFFWQRFFDRFQALPADFRACQVDLFVTFLRKPFHLKRMCASADEFRDVHKNGLQLNLAPRGDCGKVESTRQQSERFALGRGERSRLLFGSVDRGRRTSAKAVDDLEDFRSVPFGFLGAESGNFSQLFQSGWLFVAKFVEAGIEKNDERADLFFASGGKPPLTESFAQAAIGRRRRR